MVECELVSARGGLAGSRRIARQSPARTSVPADIPPSAMDISLRLRLTTTRAYQRLHRPTQRTDAPCPCLAAGRITPRCALHREHFRRRYCENPPSTLAALLEAQLAPRWSCELKELPASEPS